MIDRAKAKLMQAYLEVALTGFQEHFGVDVKLGTFRYGESNASVPLRISEIGSGGEVKTVEAENFKRFAVHYGLKPEWLGETISVNGIFMTITGLNTRARKFKVQAVTDDGKRYKLHPEQVRMSITS
jgi:hypothetical protein